MNSSDYRQVPLNIKKLLCNKVLGYAMKTLWLEDIIIRFEPMSFLITHNCDAMFLKENYTIVINENWLDGVGVAELTATILHETRHAYQCAQVDFYDYMPYQEPREKVELWRIELENYIPTSGDEHNDMDFMKQSVEIDAVAYEIKMMKDLLDIDLIPHELIADEVTKVNIVINEESIH
jgi:hypothetical protein